MPRRYVVGGAGVSRKYVEGGALQLGGVGGRGSLDVCWEPCVEGGAT